MDTPKNLTDLLDHYLALHRAGDVPGLLALHAPDAEFIIPGQPPLRGTAVLHDLFAWDAALKSELVMEGSVAKGETVIIETVIERNEWFRSLGIPEVHYEPGTRIVWRNGRIQGTYPTNFTPEIGRLVAERFHSLHQWLTIHQPDVLAQLLPSGNFCHDAANARLWLEVMNAWQHSLS